MKVISPYYKKNHIQFLFLILLINFIFKIKLFNFNFIIMTLALRLRNHNQCGLKRETYNTTKVKIKEVEFKN